MASELRRPGDGLELKLEGAIAKLVIGAQGAQTQIEISPVGYVAEEYFVATFEGPRIGALVRLNEHYRHVQDTDLLLMVGTECEVTGFPRIALVGEPGSRTLRIACRELPTRVELCSFPRSSTTPWREPR